MSTAIPMSSFSAWRAHRILAWVLVCALGWISGVAWAQSSGPTTRILQGSSVTESNVLDALTPAEEPITLRSLRVSRDSPTTQAATATQRPSASLLITFETNSAELRPEARRQLDVVAAALTHDQLRQYTFMVEGHADPRGSSQANQVLSQARAESVRNYLVQTHGIAPERLRAVGRGDTEIINSQNIAAPENRRVTIVTNIN